MLERKLNGRMNKCVCFLKVEFIFYFISFFFVLYLADFHVNSLGFSFYSFFCFFFRFDIIHAIMLCLAAFAADIRWMRASTSALFFYS